MSDEPTAVRDHNRPADNEVIIRMYGQGVGDCFLLLFPRLDSAASNRPFSVVIDCGVVGGTPDGTQRMRDVVKDIKATTLDPQLVDAGQPKGHIDLLVITHEHWDHLSGFVQAEEIWKEIQVDALWTAWTERPGPDNLPGSLKRIIEKQRKTIAAAADQAFRMGALDQTSVLQSLLGFYGDGSFGEEGFAAAKGVSDAFVIAKKLAGHENTVFCEPGEVRPLPETGVAAYVLGPPRDDDFLVKLNPSKRNPETFVDESGDAHLASLRGESLMLSAMEDARSPFNAFAIPLTNEALLSADAEGAKGADMLRERSALDRSLPIEASLRVPLPAAESEAHDHPSLASYFDPVHQWRRIDAAWLGSSAEFALRADALTNNTSLVLAFELPAKKPGAPRNFLLFTGDAQVGNWLSWDEIKAWQPLEGATPSQRKPSMQDLLARTVFYKVGHHGSHNATLKAKGVERMRTDARLTAFVPVSQAVAHEVKGWGRMPLKPMLNALAERALGRVVLPNGQIWPAEQPSTSSQAAIGLRFSDHELPSIKSDGQVLESGTKLWVEIAIPY